MAFDANQAKTRITGVMEAANNANDANEARELLAEAWTGFFSWMIAELELDPAAGGLVDSIAGPCAAANPKAAVK